MTMMGSFCVCYCYPVGPFPPHMPNHADGRTDADDAHRAVRRLVAGAAKTRGGGDALLSWSGNESALRAADFKDLKRRVS